jgi:hypothetical protein
MDDVKMDLRNTGVKRWRTRALGRMGTCHEASQGQT